MFLLDGTVCEWTLPYLVHDEDGFPIVTLPVVIRGVSTVSMPVLGITYIIDVGEDVSLNDYPYRFTVAFGCHLRVIGV
jgi:hypothetical protein